MRLTGRVFPLRTPSRDGRIITEVRIDTMPIPLYSEQGFAIGSLHELVVNHESVDGVFDLLDQPMIVNWRPGRLFFQAEMDTLEERHETPGCSMVSLSGRLRRVRLGTNPAFEGTEAYLHA